MFPKILETWPLDLGFRTEREGNLFSSSETRYENFPLLTKKKEVIGSPLKVFFFSFSFLLLFIHLEFGISIPPSTNLKVSVNRTHELTGKHSPFNVR